MIRRLFSAMAVIGATILSMVLAPDTALADKRVALIVGNSSYQSVPQLPNPSRDATSVAKMFRDAGFDSVDLLLNVGNLEFKRAIRKFENEADQADIAVVFYAGHGLEISGTNYLIPIDARLASDRDADDEAIPLERLVSSADGAKRLRLIILDACRDNPFTRTMRLERKVANRGISAGLGRVEPTSTDTLIAYAAKAGSTADDGDGQHSPFTTAVLKDLPVPGLDVRLAFGRVRDDVLKSTESRQEPFVYGSLGGGNVSLVPAPAAPQEAPVTDVKADFDLVQKFGTKRAYQVFLGTHPTGFYADLARAEIERLDAAPADKPSAPMPAPASNTERLAALPPQQQPSNPSPSKEAIEWDKIKDTSDPAVLQKFISRFPNSPLALTAKQRMDLIQQQARAAAEEAQRKAAEAAAQKKREDDERRAREAEAAEKAKAAAAEAAAQKKREEDERRAAAAEAERHTKAAEAARKAQEAKDKAELAERDKAAAEAAAAQAAADKQAREADAARQRAQAAAAKEASCKDEQGKLEAILSKGSQGTGVDDLKNFSRTVTCDRLGPVVVAAIDRFSAEAAKRAATEPNSPDLVRSAQTELTRLGCFTGTIDGKLSTPTTGALSHYLSIEGQPTGNPVVTQALVTELTKHATRVCPVECKTGETLKGDTCVADVKPQATPSPAPVTASNKSDDDNAKSRKKQQANRDQDQPRKPKAAAAPAPEAPRARQQALARPSIVSGGGGGGGGGGGSHTMIGVGF